MLAEWRTGAFVGRGLLWKTGASDVTENLFYDICVYARNLIYGSHGKTRNGRCTINHRMSSMHSAAHSCCPPWPDEKVEFNFQKYYRCRCTQMDLYELFINVKNVCAQFRLSRHSLPSRVPTKIAPFFHVAKNINGENAINNVISSVFSILFSPVMLKIHFVRFVCSSVSIFNHSMARNIKVAIFFSYLYRIRFAL